MLARRRRAPRPWPAQRSSTSAMKRSVSASDLARSAAMPPSGCGGQHGVEPAFQRRHAQDRLGAAQVARDAGGRPVVGREFERRRMAPPAGQRLPKRSSVRADAPRRRPARRGRRSGTCSRSRRRSRRRRRAGRPARRRRCAPGPRPRARRRAWAAAVDRGHVVHGAGAVVHVREHQHGGVGAERGGDLARRRPAAAAAALAGTAPAAM